MDLMTRAEFEKLVEDGDGTRVSLFAPTHRVGGAKEAGADRTRWKNLLTAVEGELEQEGLEADEVSSMMAPAWALLDDAMAWSHMADGLAMFLEPGWSASYRVPLELPELGTVGSGYVLGPVLPLLADQNYVVLTLSQKNVRVLRGSRDLIGELDVPGVPGAFDEVYETSDQQSDSVPQTQATGASVGGSTVYHGTSSWDNEHKENVTEFFREVARGVENHLAGRSIPMILAGLPEWVAIYREINSYPHLLEGAIDRNPDDMSADDLREAAWELVSERLDGERSRLLDRVHEQRARGTGAVGARDSATAAQEGRVDTLLLTQQAVYGRNGSTEVVRPLRDGDGERGLADAAARATLRNGGAVRILDELPEEALVAAVLRY
ncbi:hypothetical protein [Ornithinimicrobium sp. Y1694]|uniref:baeRF3 domain-containing protein n=1 Tax=Ornithinimicrobium sp. Y1694 TaxID=3418590 RepID=UPI003CFAFE6B